MQKSGVIKDEKLKISKEMSKLTEISLVKYVYAQGNFVLFSSLFCALIVYIGMQIENSVNPLRIQVWMAFFIIVTIYRFTLNQYFNRDKHHEQHLSSWQGLYITGAFLGGFSWGLAAIILLPYASAMEQTLLVLMLAGVTGGSVPISSAIPKAAIVFLIMSIVPFLIFFANSQQPFLQLFDVALFLYLIYCITLSLKLFHLIRHSIILQFQKSTLLEEVYQSKIALEKSNKQLHDAATHDPLTHAGNRTLFKTRLLKEIVQAEEHNKLFGLLYLDIDNFKMINDKYGHYAGDIILLAVSDRLRDFFGKNVTIARFGGDEFIVLVDKIDYPRELKNIASEVCKLISLPIKFESINIIVTVSIGISVYPSDGKDMDALLKAADMSMYYVKQHGGGSFYLSVPISETADPSIVPLRN